MRIPIGGLAALILAACQATPVAPPVGSSGPSPTITATPTPAGSQLVEPVGTEATSPSPSQSRSPEPSAEPTVDGGLPGPTGPTEKARVLRVIDGDTIVVDRGRGPETLRYIGIDTPETARPGSPVDWMGPEASAANERLVGGREVVLEKDVSETDPYGRLLRYVWIREAAGWILVEHELVRLGFAAVSTYPPDVKYADLYLVVQAEAREGGRGLWGEPPTTDPVETTEPVGSGGDCLTSYPDLCVPPTPPDLDCAWVYDQGMSHITVLAPDPHRFDGNHDGVGCESP